MYGKIAKLTLCCAVLLVINACSALDAGVDGDRNDDNIEAILGVPTGGWLGGAPGDGDPGSGNHAPRVTSAWFELDPQTLYVTVEDRDGDSPLTITLINISGLRFETTTASAENGETVSFPCWTSNQLDFGYPGLNVVVSDHEATSRHAWARLELDGSFGKVQSRLSVVPVALQTTVGEPVEVRVYTTGFSAQRPFANANSIAVTCEAGGDYVDGSYQVSQHRNCIWQWMTPPPSQYLIPDDFMMHAQPVTGDPGKVFMTFNVTPVGAVDTGRSGYLFSFDMVFDSPGTYNFGFIDFDSVERTCYSGTDGWVYSWIDIANNYHGYTTSVQVVE